MPRKPSSRVVINRQAMTELQLGVADGMSELGRTIVEVADPPDAAPYGVGLVTSGGYLVYNGSKKVDGWHQSGKQPGKPRSVKVRGTDGSVSLLVGWGFPARFQEFGTIHHGAQPFGTPAVSQTRGETAEIIRPHVRARMR